MRRCALWATVFGMAGFSVASAWLYLTNTLSNVFVQPESITTYSTTARRRTQIDLNHPLNDKTLHWDPNVSHVWWDNEQQQQQRQKQQQQQQVSHNHTSGIHTPSPAPAMLLLSNYGWNHPNQTTGLQFVRTQRTTQLVNGVLSHPWFHPTAYQDILYGQRPIDPTVHYYVFLDMETCFETNYPVWADKRLEFNSDLMGGRRHSGNRKTEPCYGLSRCDIVRHILATHPLFATGPTTTTTPQATLVLWECRSTGPPLFFRHWRLPTLQVSLQTVSSRPHQLQLPIDQGLPPPAVTHFDLSPQQRDDIDSCVAETSRSLLLTFVGKLDRHKVRTELAKLHNGNDVWMVDKSHWKAFKQQALTDKNSNVTFQEAMYDTLFAAVPRGDAPFSYRFTEVLAAGCIPVLYADDWVLPFDEEIVNWSDCLVRIRERDAHRTMQVLAQLDVATRCRMRVRCYEIYSTYIKTPAGTVQGLIQGLEAKRRRFVTQPL